MEREMSSNTKAHYNSTKKPRVKILDLKNPSKILNL